MSIGGPKLRAGGYKSLTSTLPPAMRRSISGRYAATTIPKLPAVNINEDDADFPIIEINQIDEATIQMWLEQYGEFTDLDEKTQIGVVSSLHRYIVEITEAGNEVNDEDLIQHFQHLLNIKNGDQLNAARRNFEKSSDQWSYFGFFIQHFPEWEIINQKEQSELKPIIFEYLTAPEILPSNKEIAAFIKKIHALHIKKVTIRNRIKAEKSEDLPEPIKGPITHHFESLIDEHPETSIDIFLAELDEVIFAIIQERSTSSQESSTGRISRELRIVAQVIETRSGVFQQILSSEEIPATLPEIPFAKRAANQQKTISLASLPLIADKGQKEE